MCFSYDIRHRARADSDHAITQITKLEECNSALRHTVQAAKVSSNDYHLWLFYFVQLYSCDLRQVLYANVDREYDKIVLSTSIPHILTKKTSVLFAGVLEKMSRLANAIYILYSNHRDILIFISV